jgi:Flp pilus assembly pilin Flp
MTHRLRSKLRRFLKDTQAAAMVEYVLMIAAIALGCVTAVNAMGTSIQTTLGTLTSSL